ncbi:p2x purinoceptor 1-like [Stylonychia lemnae]|uniref:p2x purinoceptor 1-like n=1 Tax=Stylonychia lemnae TaxID=5949 RepID=A0A078ARB1_STYLE|nr:p2x purinoceptor 1-like [Stylonychia lemnae]|eukprot:CDW84521.1 p2x purinoceptor 1-like [Stylonychia lemnae]
MIPDADEFFSYHTQQELNVLDRRLGYVFYTAFFFIFVYIVIYTFGIQKQYLVRIQKEGFMYLKASGEAYSTIDEVNYSWDPSNLLFMSIEDQSIFIPTKLIIERGQEIGECQNEKLPCRKDADCTRQKYPEINIQESQCLSSTLNTNKKYCTMKQWCLPKDIKPEVHILQNVEHFNLIMDSYLQFNDEIIRSQSSDGKQIEYPHSNPTQFKLNDLIQISGVTNFDKVREKGAVLITTIIWRCTEETGCSRGIEVTRMDQSEAGFFEQKTQYYVENGRQKRILTKANGIRIFTGARGYVMEWSLINIVLQISSAIGLLIASRSLTDFVMLNLFREKNHYANMKFFKTEKL